MQTRGGDRHVPGRRGRQGTRHLKGVGTMTLDSGNEVTLKDRRPGWCSLSVRKGSASCAIEIAAREKLRGAHNPVGNNREMVRSR